MQERSPYLLRAVAVHDRRVPSGSSLLALYLKRPAALRRPLEWGAARSCLPRSCTPPDPRDSPPGALPAAKHNRGRLRGLRLPPALVRSQPTLGRLPQGSPGCGGRGSRHSWCVLAVALFIRLLGIDGDRSTASADSACTSRSRLYGKISSRSRIATFYLLQRRLTSGVRTVTTEGRVSHQCRHQGCPSRTRRIGPNGAPSWSLDSDRPPLG